MPRPDKTKQVTVYLLPELSKKLEREAIKRRRKMGPTVIEILHDYFDREGQAVTQQEPKDAALVR